MSPRFDQRITPARSDLAAASLRGLIDAPRYSQGESQRIVAPIAAVRRAPSEDAPVDTQALHGEAITVYDNANGWSWGQLARDGYVGYVDSAALGPPLSATHRVVAQRTFGYPSPSIKTPPSIALPFDSLVNIASETGDFAVTIDGANIWRRHLAPIDEHETDFVAVAERFLGVPYLWGGRSPLGTDCSGLAQTALRRAGIAAPRDSDQQERHLGEPLAFDDDLLGLKRGDLVFWKGHVGIMRDAETLLHANGRHMLVVSESLRVARDRTQQKACEPITSIRRLVP